MPFEIVRNDIVNMDVDAIVNTANPKPVIGYGCDARIHAAAGPELLEARKQIGVLNAGEVAATPGFDLMAKYVLHAVGLAWQDGKHSEERLLRQCYDRALALALEKGCTSVAFPLLSAGNYGFPADKALQIAINAFSAFLMEHEMQIYLVVFDGEAFTLSEKLFSSVKSYIDENYILDKKLDEYGITDKRNIHEAELTQILREQETRRKVRHRRESVDNGLCSLPMPTQVDRPFTNAGVSELLKEMDAGFSETLLKLIERSGKKDPDIYKKANVDRKLFSKIRSDPRYQPKKTTAVAFALALELDLNETKELIGRAGYALTHSSKFDIIVEYFIVHKNYDVMELNEVLFEFDQPLIGA